VTDPSGPPIPAPDDDRVAVLAAYLRSNQGTFTDEALARAARDAGYSEAEFIAAHALADPARQAPGAAPEPGRQTNRWVVAAVAIGYVIALYAAITIAAAIALDYNGVVGLVGLLAGVAAWAVLRNERPSLAQGIGCGVILAITIPIVIIVGFIGICVATGSFPTGP
jgi:hypothetical protein